MIELFKSSGDIFSDIEVFIEYLGDKYKSNKIITTKKREKMYIVHENDNKIEDDNKKMNYYGHIYVLSSDGIIGMLKYEAIKNPNILMIKDIQYKDPDYYGIGIGTAIFKLLQEFALEEEIILIKGTLETYDIDHNRERLMNFYSKHDFNIDFYHKEVKKIIMQPKNSKY
jgi:GNAT superfamily N-acetyltransferase